MGNAMTLRREVSNHYPVGSAAIRQLVVVKYLAIAALFVTCVRILGDKELAGCTDSPEEIAALDVKRYAVEAYPLWRRQHPDLPCPESNKGSSTLDPWDSPYVFTCNATTFRVVSAGPDRRLRTADDIASSD